MRSAADLDFHPSGNFFYVTCELDGNVVAATWDSTTGQQEPPALLPLCWWCLNGIVRSLGVQKTKSTVARQQSLVLSFCCIDLHRLHQLLAERLCFSRMG